MTPIGTRKAQLEARLKQLQRRLAGIEAELDSHDEKDWEELAVEREGDEVLLEDPGWLSFEPMVRLTGATPVPFPLREENGFCVDPADLASRITPRITRLEVVAGRFLSTAA